MPYLVGYVTPQDYGAAGNGTTDDTAAVQAAINAVNAAGGGTLFLPAGTYKLSSALTSYANVNIIGTNSATCVLNQTSTSANGINIVDAVAVVLRDFTVTGPGSGTGVGINFSLSSRSSCYQLDLSDLLVGSFGSNGIAMATPIVTRLARVVTRTNGGDGFHITGGGTSLFFEACYSNGNTGNGYNLNQLNYSSLNGCACDTFGGIGYLLTNCNQVVLTGCGAEAGTGTAYTVTGGTGNSVISCYNRANNLIGVYFTGSTLSGYVTGFFENSPTGSATASIKVDAGSRVLLGPNQTTTATSLDVNGTSYTTGNGFYCGGNGGTSSFQLNRGATSNFATYQLLTNGVEQWVLGGMLNDGTNDLHVQDAINAVNSLIVEQHPVASNVQIGAAKSFGGGIGVLGLTNAATVPTTNPTGGTILYATSGGLFTRDPNGTVSAMVADPRTSMAMPGSLAETVNRYEVTVAAAPTSGTLYLQPVWLPAGTTVSKVGFCTGSTAATSPTHWWVALLDSTYKQQAHSADQLTGAMAASTWFNLSLAASYKATYTGTFYVALLIAATTTPTILQSGAGTPAAQFISGAGVPTPLIGGLSTTALTAPGTDGTTVYAAPTAATAPFYLYCS